MGEYRGLDTAALFIRLPVDRRSIEVSMLRWDILIAVADFNAAVLVPIESSVYSIWFSINGNGNFKSKFKY
jgi:hypothetical protein